MFQDIRVNCAFDSTSATWRIELPEVVSGEWKTRNLSGPCDIEEPCYIVSSVLSSFNEDLARGTRPTSSTYRQILDSSSTVAWILVSRNLSSCGDPTLEGFLLNGENSEKKAQVAL